MPTNFLLISHMHVHDANALSSLCIGTPALTSFLGMVHALERKLNLSLSERIHFSGVGICMHQIRLNRFRDKDRFYSLVGTANTLDKSGNRPSFIENARCDLVVSLLLTGNETFPANLEQQVQQQLQTMKLAGGDIENIRSVKEIYDTEKKTIETSLKRELMPGYWLLDRSDLMKQAMESGQDALQALLYYLATQVHIEKNSDITTRLYSKNSPGWFVPIAVGFQGLSPSDYAVHQRDESTPHRFAESVITLGDYKMVHKIQTIEDILWRYCFDSKSNLYLCQQNR